MKTMRLFPLELKRLLQSRLTWLTMALTVLSPVLGLVLYKPATSTTMLSMYLANPAIAGGVAGAILFGLLTIFELDRACRSRVDILTDAVVSPLTTALTRLLALLTAAVLTVGLTMLVWLPISTGLIGSVFTGANYVLAYLLFMGLALPLGILTAAAAYQFTRRADLSIVLFIAFCALSLTVWAAEWQLCWLNPCVWALSDDFSNFRVFRSVAWMRFTWLLTLAGVWTFSYLCIRQYGKDVFGSLARSVRRLYRPVIALALLACSGTAYAAQPFIDHSNPDLTVMSFYEIPYAEGVTFVRRTAQVFPDTDAGTVTGRASYQFQNTSGQEQSVSFGINPGYAISNVKANGADVPFTVSDYQEYNEALLEVTIPAEEDVELTMEYSGFPQESLPTMQGGKELSGEYLCLENSALSPRVMNVMPGEAGYPAEIEITLPENMLAIPFGSSEAKVVAKHEDGTRTWRYEQNGAGGILYAGDYIREDIEAGGMTIALPEEDRSYLSKGYMEDQIVALLGGRTAEELCLGDISTGASNDIQRATQIARKMVASYGMSERIGTVCFDSGHEEVFIGRTMAQGRSYSETVAAEIDEEIKRVVGEAGARCRHLLETHRAQLDAVANYLLQHETMEREEFVAVFDQPDAQKAEQPTDLPAEKQEPSL